MAEGYQKQKYGSTSDRIPEVEFSNVDISELSGLVEKSEKDTKSVNDGRRFLERSIKLLGTSKDSQSLRDSMQSLLISMNETAHRATADLQKLKLMVRRDKVLKLQVERIIETFQECLEICTPVQELAVAKMRTHILPSERAIYERSHSIQSDDRQQLTTTEMRLATEEIEFDHGMLMEREQRMNEIAKTIIDVHQIMKELSGEVYKQREDIDSIENAIEDVQYQVESAESELQKASQYQASRRRKTCFLLGISVVIGVILAIIIALSLRK